MIETKWYSVDEFLPPVSTNVIVRIEYITNDCPHQKWYFKDDEGRWIKNTNISVTYSAATFGEDWNEKNENEWGIFLPNYISHDDLVYHVTHWTKEVELFNDKTNN